MSTEKSNGATYLNAFTVEEFEATGGKGAKTARRWTKIGVAFPHKDGAGFNIELKALPLDGRVILLPPDADDSNDKPDARDARR